MRLNWLFVFCVTALLAYSFGHIYVFGAALDEESWEHVFGFTRIIIPDTFRYLAIANAENAAEFFLLVGTRNSIGPSLVWLIFQENWYLVSIFNTICFLFVLIYTKRLIILLDSSQKSKCYSVSLILTLVCMYYSVGSLKEIPTLLGITAFVYHFLTKQKTKALMWFLFLTLFRFQFSYIIIPVYLLSKVRRNPLRLTLISLVVVGMIFPLISVLDVFMSEDVKYFRTPDKMGSLGAQVEFVRDHVFGLSLFAIIIRMVQTILEPLIYFLNTLSFYEDGSLGLYQVHSAVVLLLMLRAWGSVLFGRLGLISDRDGCSANVGIFYSFLAIAIFTIGGTGLLSHRYLVPVYGLLLVAAHVNPLKRERSLVNKRTAAWPLRSFRQGHAIDDPTPVAK